MVTYVWGAITAFRPSQVVRGPGLAAGMLFAGHDGFCRVTSYLRHGKRNVVKDVIFQTQNLAHPRPRRYIPRTSRGPFEPLVKRPEFHSVFDRRISGQDANRKVLADVLDPTALTDRTQAERNRFVKAFGSHLGAVLDSLGIDS